MTPTLFIFAVFLIFVGWFVFSPLMNHSSTNMNMILDNTPDSQKLLQQKRSSLMLTLKELDFDFEMGKLSKEDYQSLKKKYEQETIDVLRQIDVEKDLWDKFQNDLDKKLEKKNA
jgi:hypothetical protein